MYYLDDTLFIINFELFVDIATGSSGDWVKGNFKTPIVFTYELRDRGQNGFLLPAGQIIPTGEETLDSVVSILVEGERYIRK